MIFLIQIQGMIIRLPLLSRATRLLAWQASRISNSDICPRGSRKLNNNNSVLVSRNSNGFATDHKYKQKTTKQIQKQIGSQKWRQMQNTFKSLSTQFGLRKPSAEDLLNPKFSVPPKIEYTLETLRECSQNYPVYLHWELEKDRSPFNQLIDKVINNLWKAEQKQTMQFLQFLHAWDYKKVDVRLLYERVIERFDLSMDQLFKMLRMFEGKINNVTQLKVLRRLEKQDLSSSEYSGLLKIINYFTIKKLITQQFYRAATRVVSNNINRIPPVEALEAYVYYTYNINEHLAEIKKEPRQEAKDQSPGKEDLGINILNIIEKRILSPECIKFYNGEQLVALLHTFLKNNLILSNESATEQYNTRLNKIIDRISLVYFASDFSTRDKRNLLQISSLLPELKKQTLIALVQKQLLNKKQKFDHSLLPTLYLISYENNMLTDDIKNKAQQLIAQNIFNIDRKQISRILWLLTITRADNLNSIHKKMQSIVEGGFRDFTIKDVCIIVWSMSAEDYNQNGRFWDNIQSFLHEELNRKYKQQSNAIKDKSNQGITSAQQKKSRDVQLNSNRKLVNDCAWVLWAYHNNRFLKIRIIDLITEIIIKQFKSPQDTILSIKLQLDDEKTMTVFELTSITSFYYSLEFPSETILREIKQICSEQFKRIYKTMQPIQLCKCLKYMGQQVWKDKQLLNNILEIFQVQINAIAYKDIMAVVAILISSGVKNNRVVQLIKKLMERKKRLESLEKFGTDQGIQSNSEKKVEKQKQHKWKFPI